MSKLCSNYTALNLSAFPYHTSQKTKKIIIGKSSKEQQHGKRRNTLACFPSFHSFSKHEIINLQVSYWIRPKELFCLCH